MPAEGTLTLQVRDQQVGEGHIRTQPGKFDLTGPGFLLGRSGGEPVSDDYPGQSPWPIAGGTVNRVLIDGSGEPFADLARDAAAAYARMTHPVDRADDAVCPRSHLGAWVSA